MKRARWFAAVLLATALGVGLGAPQAAPPKKDVKDAPLSSNSALKPKIDKRMAPFTFGMTPEAAMKKLDEQLDELYMKKISGAYNPKAQASLEKERDKKKAAIREKLFKFTPKSGVGYEVKAPGEFTYKNEESALEVAREGGGVRHLFFIKDKGLWKIYDHWALGGKDNELGETWESALAKFEKEILGAKGMLMPEKKPSPAYFGTIILVPQHYLWSDGKTQVRLVDHTKREDSSDKMVGIAYESVEIVGKLPELRSNVESKASDAAVDKAGAPDVSVSAKKDKPKK
jgi:hypothetical protein